MGLNGLLKFLKKWAKTQIWMTMSNQKLAMFGTL